MEVKINREIRNYTEAMLSLIHILNNGGDAAEQIVRLSLEGFEVAVRLKMCIRDSP